MGEAAGQRGVPLDALQRAPEHRRIVLVQRGLRLHPQARERRADLVLGLGDERLHRAHVGAQPLHEAVQRSEEHPSELQSLMRTSYAFFYLKQKKLYKIMI